MLPPDARRVSVDPARVQVLAATLPRLAAVRPFDFCTGGEDTLYPPRGAPGVLDFFFFSCTHQYGFWSLDGNRFGGPMYAVIDGVRAKGSDFLTRALMRAWRRDSTAFAPRQLARLSDAECDALFHDDAGSNPLPMRETHLELVRRYAAWFTEADDTPAALLARAQADPSPLAAFLSDAGEVPGYAEDPLQKKLMLLAIILENRPEGFLHVSDPESAVPIIDYHLQRSALRTGLVRVEDPTLAAQLERRERVNDETEAEIRQATFDAIVQLVDASGLSVAAIDWFFFTNRTRCPEMSEPNCAACPIQPVCARLTHLFQPVFRTTAY